MPPIIGLPKQGRTAFDYIKAKFQRADPATTQQLLIDLQGVSLADHQGNVELYEKDLTQRKLAYFQAVTANGRHSEIPFFEASLVSTVVAHFDQYDHDLYKVNCTSLRQNPVTLDQALTIFKNERKAHLTRLGPNDAAKPPQSHVLTTHTAGAGRRTRNSSSQRQRQRSLQALAT
jgi:hypothetical protein